MTKAVIQLVVIVFCGSSASAALFLSPSLVYAQLIDLPPPLSPPRNNGTQSGGGDGTEDGGDDSGAGNTTSSGSDDNPVPLLIPDGNSTSTPEPPFVEPQTLNETSPNQSESVIIENGGIISASPCLEYDEEEYMIEILCDLDIYELFSGLRHDTITQQLGLGQILINTNITVNEDATFNISSDRGITYVAISGNNGITVYGKMDIGRMKITSWDSI